MCRHNLTASAAYPKWRINGKVYLSTSLPLHYQLKRREQFYGISFKSIEGVNLTTIACCYYEDTCSNVFTVKIAGKINGVFVLYNYVGTSLCICMRPRGVTCDFVGVHVV